MMPTKVLIPSARVIAWMNALRHHTGETQYRILENFWESQIKSKAWIITMLKELNITSGGDAYVFGGWYGVMASMLADNCGFRKVYSIDADCSCKIFGEELDQQETSLKIEFVTSAMEDFTFDNYTNTEKSYGLHYGLHKVFVYSSPRLIINTSVEHIATDVFNRWLSNVPDDVPIVLQGNNLDIPEHVRIATSLEDFKKQNPLQKILWEGELDCETFTRYMIIGYKNEAADI